MSQGSAPRQADVFRDTSSFVEPRVRPDSIYALLARGMPRPCSRTSCSATCSRTRAALGTAACGGGRDGPPAARGAVRPRGGRAVHVRRPLEVRLWRPAVRLPGLRPHRARRHAGAPGPLGAAQPDLRAHARGRAGRGLVGVRRVLDSTPLYDAVATMDTVTLVRSAIRGVLGASGDREPALRSVLRRDDDYRTGGKPAADWDDAAARRPSSTPSPGTGRPCSRRSRASRLPPPLAEAATLLATVLGQDLEDGPTAGSGSPAGSRPTG